MPRSRPTRGRTRPGRLALLDPWLAERLGSSAQSAPCVVDVGLGAEPDTTLELHAALAERVPGVVTLGLDVDAERVERLRERAVPGVQARLGGFDTALPAAQLVRAANLLRQYRLDAVDDALEAMGRWLAPEGLLVEGTTDRHGERGVFRVLEPTAAGLRPVRLVLLCDPAARGFAPWALTAYVPRGLGWHGHPGPQLAPFFEAWNRAFDAARDHGADSTASLFQGAAERLVDEGIAPDSSSEDHAAGRLVVPFPASPA